jgi:hypothetical protein
MTKSMTFPQLRSLSNGDGRMTTTAPDDETPVLLIRRTINRHTITIWCKHCKREHWHGRSAGHRIGPLRARLGVALSTDGLCDSMSPANEYTDLSNAKKFARQHRAKLRYVSKSRQWYVWDGQRWRPDDTSEVQRRAKATVEGFAKKAKKADSEQRADLVRMASYAQSAGRIGGMIS